MKRRCDFLENIPAFYYNTGAGELITDEQGNKIKTDTRQLGSTIMQTMLDEVANFCDPDMKKNWSSKPHQQVSHSEYKGSFLTMCMYFIQLIYDKGSFGLVSLQPDHMSEDLRKKYQKIGFKIHTLRLAVTTK